MKKSWRDPSLYLNKIFVDKECKDDPHTIEIIRRAGLPHEVVTAESLHEQYVKPYPENLSEGKRHLFLTYHKGQFFKECPATREYRCCDYHVLNTGMNCPIDCTYCILQAYLNNPWISYFINTSDLTREVSEVLSRNPRAKYRIGTGEFTDSLALDRLTRLSTELVPLLANHHNGVLELKTKSAVIDNLEHLDHQGKTIISWSLNSASLMATQELRSATLDERLEAAARVASWGYPLGFHFDPVIYHEDWEDGYRETISRMVSRVPVESIVWISIGALRYLPPLKEIGTSRFPNTRIFFQEFIEGLDGKARYFRDSRVALYKVLYSELKKHLRENTCVYFCMESDEIWQEVMGFTPQKYGGIATMLEHAFFSRKVN